MSETASAPAGLTTHRIEAFSDGVFAIVITLLVFEIKVPQMAMGNVEIALLHELGKLWPKFLSFVLSFVIVGIYWVAHHQLFHVIRRSDRTLLWLNNLFLLTVAFIPFPTALMGDYISAPIAVVPYGVTLITNGLALQLLWWYASRRARLVPNDLGREFIRAVDRRILLPVFLYAVAILLSILSARLTLIVYVLVPLTYILPGDMDRHLGRLRPA